MNVMFLTPQGDEILTEYEYTLERAITFFENCSLMWIVLISNVIFLI